MTSSQYSTELLLKKLSITFFICLFFQLPLSFYHPTPTTIQLTLFAHIVLAVVSCCLATAKRVEHARALLLLTCLSYLTLATIAWPTDTYIQHFLLVGAVGCAFLFKHDEKKQRIGWLSAFTITFCLIDLTLSYSLPPSEQIVRQANCITLSVAIICIGAVIQRHLYARSVLFKTQFDDVKRALYDVIPACAATFPYDFSTRKDINNASVIFTDLCGYQSFAKGSKAHDAFKAIDSYYRIMDELAHELSVWPLKTNGDQYIALAVPEPDENDLAATLKIASKSVVYAIRLLKSISQYKKENPNFTCGIRIGIAIGTVTAGMPERRHGTFDIWGDTVNKAAMLEHYSDKNCLTICKNTHNHLPTSYKHYFSSTCCATKIGNIAAFTLSESALEGITS
jgi:adenylate cyclase